MKKLGNVAVKPLQEIRMGRRLDGLEQQTSLARIKDVAAYAKSFGIEAACADFKLSGTTVRDYMQRAASYVETEEKFESVMSRFVPKVWDTAPHFSGDGMLLADGHCPFVSRAVLTKVVEVAKHLNIRQLFLPGDWFDFEDLSKFDFGGDQFDAMDELKIGKEMLQALLVHFDEIHLFRGNHEERLIKFLKRVKRAMKKDEDLKKFEGIVQEALDGPGEDTAWHEYEKFLSSDKVHIYNDAWFTMDSASGIPFRITHPSTMTNIPGNSEERLAQKHNSHIVGTHVHNYGVRVTMDGQKLAVRIGCGCDPSRVFYYNKRDTSNYKWVKGFGFIWKGKVGTWIEHQDVCQVDDFIQGGE
jgi:hypothetical protein